MSICYIINVFANIGCPEFRHSNKHLCDTKLSVADISLNLLNYESKDILEGRCTSATPPSFEIYSGRSESTSSITSEPKGTYLVLTEINYNGYYFRYSDNIILFIYTLKHLRFIFLPQTSR